MGIVTIGCAAGIAAFVDPLVYVVFRLAGLSVPQVLDAVGRGLCVTSMSLVAVGATIPAWSKNLARDPYTFWRAYRAHRRLEPLWSVLRDAAPQIALNQRARNVEFRLYRQVIEIRDGILTVRADIDEATRHQVTRCARERGLEGADVEAVIEAAAIHRAVSNTDAVLADPSANLEVIGGSNLDDEVAWLSRVALGYAHITGGRCATCTASASTWVIGVSCQRAEPGRRQRSAAPNTSRASAFCGCAFRMSRACASAVAGSDASSLPTTAEPTAAGPAGLLCPRDKVSGLASKAIVGDGSEFLK